MGVRAGQAAPEFQCRSDDGASVSLAALRGGWAVLLFLPRVGGAACPPDLLDLQAAQADFGRLGARVVAVSLDTEARLAAWRDLGGLTFPVVPDGGRGLSRRYGVAGGLGGLLGLPDRRAVLVDPAGTVAQVRRVWSARGLAQRALTDLETLQARPVQRPAT